MARLPKKTDNEIVAEWLIEHRWKETLNSDTKQKEMHKWQQNVS